MTATPTATDALATQARFRRRGALVLLLGLAPLFTSHFFGGPLHGFGVAAVAVCLAFALEWRSTSMRRLLLVLTVLALPASSAVPLPPAAELPARRAVLVTGASSGIGRKTVELLAANGFYVYAGARKDEDLKALSAIENVQALRLDVTEPEQIEAAVKAVREAGRGLHGLVNNAGVVVFGPLIELPERDLQFQLDVNVFGPYRVTKAFAALLIESRGRVATTGSISGFVTWPMGGAYTMSKHAIEAYSDTLARELEPFGVAVSVVDPGNYRSEIVNSARQHLQDSGAAGAGSRYGAELARLLEGPGDRAEHKEPDEVAAAFLRVLTEEQPPRRVMVVPDRDEALLTLRAALQRVVELNAEQPHSLDREALIALLDEALRTK